MRFFNFFVPLFGFLSTSLSSFLVLVLVVVDFLVVVGDDDV